MNIVFGTKRLVQSGRNASVEKYESRAVVTIECAKGHKKARRILFNTTASRLLGLEPGGVQEVVFAPIEDTRQILIANLATIEEEARGEMVTYRTSKNKVSFGDDSTEKGKAATTSFMCKELFSFFGKDDTTNLEFELMTFPSEDLEAFSLEAIGSSDLAGSIETNNETIAIEDVIDSVQETIAKQEEANPVMEVEVIAEEIVAEEIVAEEAPIFQRAQEAVAEEPIGLAPRATANDWEL